MAFLGQTFNENELPEGEGFEPIPNGWYDAQIEAADVKETKSGPGSRLNVRFKIIGPEHAGRVVFAGINTSLPNSPKAEEIGRQQLGELMRAIGVTEVSDSDDFIGYHLRIRVKTRAAQNGYPASNEVASCRPMDGDAAEVTAAPAAASRPRPVQAPAPVPAPARTSASSARASAPVPAAKKSPPWARK